VTEWIPNGTSTRSFTLGNTGQKTN